MRGKTTHKPNPSPTLHLTPTLAPCQPRTHSQRNSRSARDGGATGRNQIGRNHLERNITYEPSRPL
jgi:hypothetical protein